jgi:hypothetical protein
MSKKISEKSNIEKSLKFFNLNEKTHDLNGITLLESINVENLDKLLKSNLLKKTFNSPFADIYYENEREQLKEFKKLIKRGEARITYKMTKGISFGRVIPDKGLGLFNLRREIRQTLCKDFYVDIDVENCHPVILDQICKKNKIKTNYLSVYIQNRDEKLKDVMTLYDCDRDTAKKLFIRIMYFGSYDLWIKEYKFCNKKIKFVEKFAQEMREIGQEIFENNQTLYNQIKNSKEERGRKDFNEVGSTVSYYLQEWEHRVLEEMYFYLEGKGIIKDDCVLAADGIMIKKEKYNESLLSELEKVIYENLELKVTITQKEMKDFYSDDILNKSILTTEEYEKDVLGGYNTTIETKGDFHIDQMTEYFEEDMKNIMFDKYKNDEDIFTMSKSFKYFNHYHFCHYQSNTLYKMYNNKMKPYGDYKGLCFLNHKEDKKTLLFSDIYDSCKKKNIYSSFEFNPNTKEKSDAYNLFRGFKYDDTTIIYDESKISHYLDHFRFMFNDEDASNYGLNWISHIIQKPETKTDVAIVIFSQVEGVGKNILWDFITKLLEGYTAKFRDTDAICDRFNGELMGKLICIGDEIESRAQHIANQLKDIITRREEVIEFKGKDKILIKDFKNYAFTTNNENVFKISDSDRRFMMVEAPLEKKSPEHYNKLIDILGDEEAMKHLHYYFKNRDIKNFSTRNIIKTEYKKRLILEHIPAYFKYMNEMKYKEDREYTTAELYKETVDFARTKKIQSTYTETVFSRQFKEVFKDFNKLEKTTRRSIYIFPENSFTEVQKLITNYFKC